MSLPFRSPVLTFFFILSLPFLSSPIEAAFSAEDSSDSPHPPNSILHLIGDQYQLISIPSDHYPSHRRVNRVLAASGYSADASSSASSPYADPSSSPSPPSSYVPLPPPTSHPSIHTFHFSAFDHSLPLRLVPSFHKFTSANFSVTRVSFFPNGSRNVEEDEVITRDQMPNCYYHLKADVDKVEETERKRMENGEADMDGEGVNKPTVHFGAVHTCDGGYSGLIVSSAGSYGIEPAHRHMSTLSLSSSIDHSVSSSHYSVHIVYPLSALKVSGRCGVDDENAYGDAGHVHHHRDPTSGGFHTQAFHPSDSFPAPSSHRRSKHDQEVSVTYSDPDWYNDAFPGSGSGAGGSGRSPSHSFHTMAGTQNYVELIVANDYRRTTAMAGKPETHSNALVNIVNSLYTQASGLDAPIQIVLIGQITFANRDPWNVSLGNPSNSASCQGTANHEVCADTLLGLWNSWRRNSANTVPYQNHDNGQLFSGYDFQSQVLGLAYIPAMCIYSQSSGIEQITIGSADAFNGAIIAHEMGHNFDMSHDRSPPSCPQSGFIMNAVIDIGTYGIPNKFSPCSIAAYNDYAGPSGLTCTRNQPAARWGDPVCGNGVVEIGEQCDCGRQNCAAIGNKCCNGYTCQFFKGATCNDDNLCCSNCTIISAKAKHECRPKANDCDFAELCDGVSEACPDDEGKPAGSNCQVPRKDIPTVLYDGYCYERQCLSYDKQCYDAGKKFTNQDNWRHCPSDETACQTLWCTNDTVSRCQPFIFESVGSAVVYVSVADGTVCTDNTLQCSGGECVDSDSLNTRIRWVPSEWRDWPDCGNGDCLDPEQRNVSCQNTKTGQLMDDSYCLTRAKPISYRQFEPGTDIVIWSYTITQFSLIIGLIAGLLGYVVVVACCYKLVTAQEDGVEDQKEAAGEGGGKGGSRRTKKEARQQYKGSHAPGFSDAYRQHRREPQQQAPSASAAALQHSLGGQPHVQRGRAGSVQNDAEHGHLMQGEVHHVRYASVHHAQSPSS